MKNLVQNWEKLRIIGKSKVIGLTALIPFIGYLLLFNDTIISYISLSQDILGFDKTDSFPISRLYFLYFGLMFLGFSSILFALLCPNEIKLNPSEYEYISNEINIMTNSRLASICKYYNIMLTKGSDLFTELEMYSSTYRDADRKAESAYPSSLERQYKFARELEEASKLNILGFNWRYKNQSRLKARALILLGYFLGFVLILIPSVTVFGKVIINLYDKY